MLKLIMPIAIAVLLAAALHGFKAKECRAAEEDEEAMPGVNPHDWYD